MSSDSDDENSIQYGTPLDPYEEDEVPTKKKFQQQAEQYAVDSHGRRRFHGAFTGGFSAGFQNTAGTAEGWTPSVFKSSRTEKAQKPSQRPEDFMDEEDRSEFGIAPRHVQTHSEFSGQKRPRQRQFHDGPIPGEPVLEQLVRAVHETAAVRMLRAMGWRPGQGAGARLGRRGKRRARRQHKVYGCYMPPAGQDKEETPQPDSDSSDSEYDYDTLFAPDDYEPYVLARKSDRFGLGYSGLSRRPVLGGLAGEWGGEGGATSHLQMKDKGRKVSIRGQAFGVGAFEADDDDIYATEDMSHYDFTIGGAPPQQIKESAKKEKNVLEGFVRSSKPFPSVPRYPPPALPRGYAPAPAGGRRTRFEPSEATPRDQGLGRHELTAQARGALLGETPIKPIQEDPIQPPTPVQAIQPKQPDPIAQLLGRNVNFTSTTTEEPKELDFISIKDSGKEITKVFKPFAANLQKQRRYEQFVKDRDGFMRERESTMDRLSEWERNREMVEFEQASKLYRPLTGEMGDRFTHASEPDEGATNPLLAVAKSKSNYGLATPDQIAAAETGVYGVLTRTTVQWRPEGLVCKRFNVPDPGVDRAIPQKNDKPKVSYSIFSYLETSVHDRESFAKEQATFGGSKSLSTETIPKPTIENKHQEKTGSIVEMPDPKPSTSESSAGFSKRMTVAELFLKESEKDMITSSQGEPVTETIEKFDKMDLYKSIFLSDSEDETPKEDESKIKEINFDDFVDVPKNVERNTSPPRGIFANIDFDELNSWRRSADAKKPDQSEKDGNTTNTSQEKGQSVSSGQDLYGPKLPENIQTRLETADLDNFKPVFKSKAKKEEVIHEVSSSSSDSWVDIKEIKSKKVKKKKTKKHKSKHKKSKHKKKDR